MPWILTHADLSANARVRAFPTFAAEHFQDGRDAFPGALPT